MMESTKVRCIHIDMDCFYAAIEERENPELKGHPVAVGGDSPRSVLCTANYEARKYGCKSAMPAFKAKELCPKLIIVPVRMDLYQEISYQIREIYEIFTESIEPLSLDEAYLDVSHLSTAATTVAKEIRHLIQEKTGLTASAGISSNKMLAKIASDWNKPNGQHEIKCEDIADFMRSLPVKKLWGVGAKSLEKLKRFNIETCADIHPYSKVELYQMLGNWGTQLYDISRGIDNRAVKTSRISKSLSKETTFSENINSFEDLEVHLNSIIDSVELALANSKHSNRGIKTNLIKLKFADFTQTTVERSSLKLDPLLLNELLSEAWKRGSNKPVRLLGAGVKFQPVDEITQLTFFTNQEHQ